MVGTGGITSGLQIGWNIYGGASGYGTSDFLNWAQNGTGGFTFNSIAYSFVRTELANLVKGRALSTTLPSNGAAFQVSGSINALAYYINGVALSTGQWVAGSGFIYYSGPVSINKSTTPGYTLDVNGTVGATSFNATSDYRIKENPQPINVKIHNIDNLKPITYKNLKTNLFDFGLIAHELQEHFPSLVANEKDDVNHLQTVNYIALIPVLISEIQELKKQNKMTQRTLLYLQFITTTISCLTILLAVVIFST
jgi:hypothetical protein